MGIEDEDSVFGTTLAGTTKVTAVDGIFEKIDLYLKAEPGSTQWLKILISGMESFEMNVFVDLRECVAGEAFTEGGE